MRTLLYIHQKCLISRDCFLSIFFQCIVLVRFTNLANFPFFSWKGGTGAHCSNFVSCFYTRRRKGSGMCYATVIGFVAWSDHHPPPPPLFEIFMSWGTPPGFGLGEFLVLRDPPLVSDLENFWSWETPPPAGKFAGRCRSEVKKNSILLGVLDLENFQLWDPPLAGKFAGRSRSVVTKMNFVRGFGLRKFLVDGTPPAGKFAGRCRSEVKNNSILLEVLDVKNFWSMGPPRPGSCF